MNEPKIFIMPNAGISKINWLKHMIQKPWEHIDGLVQERRNSIANALEVCFFLH